MSPAAALLVTRDDLLLDDVLRLAAAAGLTLDVAHDTTSAMRGWSSAGLVLVGADLAEPLARQHPPRREQVHVVGHAPLPDAVFRSALAAGARDVVELPTAETWLVEVLSDASDADGLAGGPARTVGVLPGSGGAGATTFAAALAVVAARRWTSALLDLDPLGPGLDRVVALQGPGVRWDALVSSQGRLGLVRCGRPCPTAPAWPC